MAGDSGSILVDAVVASAIIAITLGATFEVLGSVRHRQGQMDDRREALLVARSEMAAVGSEIALAPGRSEGLAGDYVWRVEVTPYAQPGPASKAGDLALVRVSVSLRQDKTELTRLSTLRLMGAAG